jgi:hypothetical protein
VATYPRFQDHLHRPASLLRRTLLFALGMMAGAAIAAGVAVAVDDGGSAGGSVAATPSEAVFPVDSAAPGPIQIGVPVDLSGSAVSVDPVTHGFFNPAAAGATQPAIAVSAPATSAGTVDGPGPLAFAALPDFLAALGESAPAHAGVGAISPEELAEALRGF